MLSRRALLAGSVAAAVPAEAAPLAATPLSRDLPWWRARHEAKLRERTLRPVDLVFLGDSITQQYEKPDYQPVWQRFYGDRHPLNLGFIGDATSHLLWRIESGEVDGLSPHAAVILIGANNLGHLHWSAEDTVAGIDAVVAATRRRLPRTRLVLVSVLPSDRGPWVWDSTRRINRALAARHADILVDVTPLFVEGGPSGSGHVDVSQFADPLLPRPAPALHPTPAAQARMAAALEPAVARAMGDRVHA